MSVLGWGSGTWCVSCAWRGGFEPGNPARVEAWRVEGERADSNSCEASGRISVALEARDSEAVGEAEQQVAHGHAAALEETAARQGAAAAAGEEDGQIDVGMSVSVGVAASVNDHRILEQ